MSEKKKAAAAAKREAAAAAAEAKRETAAAAKAAKAEGDVRRPRQQDVRARAYAAAGALQKHGGGPTSRIHMTARVAMAEGRVGSHEPDFCVAHDGRPRSQCKECGGGSFWPLPPHSLQ